MSEANKLNRFVKPRCLASGISCKLDLEWGGPEYKDLDKFKLSDFKPDGEKVLEIAFKYFKKVALKTPNSFDFSELEKFGKQYDVENNIIDKLLNKKFYAKFWLGLDENSDFYTVNAILLLFKLKIDDFFTIKQQV